MPKLTKRDVERLLAAYDADPVGALRAALAAALARPGDTWPALVDAAGLPAEWRAALLRGDEAALDRLARRLNEERTVPGASG